ncbi:Kinesin light chain 3 [Lignoscripta atroalba]|nr:Kinesin light chain 3 [Lignoscripta atroalba]
MGLTVLHPLLESNEDLKVDLVAVHGLNGSPTETWRHPKTKAFWLQDFLPLDVIGARVFSFGYNADVAFGNTTAHIDDISRDLLSSLVDKREDDNEQRRPIIFIAHSLGGIVVKRALFQARIETQYKSIGESTVGIVFLGTPHRGSEKATYGKILANIATTASRRPTSQLLNALQVNSEFLMGLTSNFKFQLPNYQVVSFYELRPTKPFSTLVVEKCSALLEINGEDQIPVDANHSDMCKFEARSDEVYEKLSKRLNRMLKAKKVEPFNISGSVIHNQYYNVPHNVSSMFTGRQGICQELEEKCLPSKADGVQNEQMRFVLYGLGGSGKTQVCLKFAQDNREKFWGIFWIDASSNKTVEQGYEDVGQTCGLEKDVKIVQRWLSNSKDPWLLIFDNADDPGLDVSQYFPAGNRGTILLTTRNPECMVHATVGSFEFGQMVFEEAVTLLVKTAAIENLSREASQRLAKPIVETLGCLALAIVQAGAVIRQKLCTMEEYCDIYSRQRRQLLSHQPVQASSDYRFTVYTTWEVSVNMIKGLSNEAAKNAIELLQFFSFLHFDGIPKVILEKAWTNMQMRQSSEWTQAHQLRLLCNNRSENLEPFLIWKAVTLLSSFSLISIDGMNNRISMHPLVHVWARDQMIETELMHSWTVAASTLAISISWEFQSDDYTFRRLLLPHVNSCLKCHQRDVFTTDDGLEEMLNIVDKFALVYSESGQTQEAVKLSEQVLKVRKRILGDEHPDTLKSMNNLACSYSDLGQRQEALKLSEQVLKVSKRILGDEHPDTLTSMNNLANSYSDLGQRQDALKLREQVLKVRKRILGDEHPDTLTSMNNLAISYSDLGQRQDALKLREQVLKVRKRILGDEHPDTLTSMNNLANSYSDLDQRQEALRLREQVLEVSKRVLGDEHPDTLLYMNNFMYFSAGSKTSTEISELRYDLKDTKKTFGTRWNPKKWIKKNR